MIIEVPSFIERSTIHRTLSNYINRSNHERIIMIKWKNKLLVYSNKKTSE